MVTKLPTRLASVLESLDFDSVCRPRFAFRMEPANWENLDVICKREGTSPQEFVAQAESAYPRCRTGRAVRLHILNYLKQFVDNGIGETGIGRTAPSKRKARLLLIDDDPDVLTVAADGLSHAGFEVIAARGGNDALRRVDV